MASRERARKRFDWDKGRMYGEGDDLPARQKKIRDKIKRNLAGRRSKLAATTSTNGDGDSDPVMQQSDVFKPFLVDIGNYGLNYAYKKYQPVTLPNPPPVVVAEDDVEDPFEEFKQTQTEHPIDVLVIGAGMSGLAAAYELSQVGHRVTVLEMQHRVGGRIKTISDSHFYKGLWADGKFCINSWAK